MTTSDLAETIARVKDQARVLLSTAGEAVHLHIRADDLTALLSAAEAGIAARDAALEEAAQAAEDSEPDAGFCDGAVKEHSAFIAFAIRSLKGAA